jgi:hypothetical protein
MRLIALAVATVGILFAALAVIPAAAVAQQVAELA